NGWFCKTSNPWALSFGPNSKVVINTMGPDLSKMALTRSFPVPSKRRTPSSSTSNAPQTPMGLTMISMEM
ncbi:MAG: hypothetical protein VXY88_05295, partial [Bacteroidota bacterium]|nr:hypothetical protein [Bacteroidota bacterium]